MIGWGPVRTTLFGLAVLMVALGVALVAGGLVLAQGAEHQGTRDRCADAVAAVGAVLGVEGGLAVYAVLTW